MKSLYMESTEIDAGKTIAEIEYYLAQAGATGIAKTYGPDKQPTAVMFKLPVAGKGEIPFLLPAREEPVFQHLQRKLAPQNRQKSQERNRAQAKRVAWRQVLRWVQAQLAMIETGMVKVEEVFLPYIQVGLNETLFQKLESGGFRGYLTAGDGT